MGKISHQPTLSLKVQFAEFNICNIKDIFLMEEREIVFQNL